MYPFVPSDVRVRDDPPAITLDGLEVPLSEAGASRARQLTPLLTGRSDLASLALPGRDAVLVRRLLDQRIAFDLHLGDDAVPTVQFCDYLYVRIRNWRSGKSPGLWPWRGVISRGEASTGYLQGLVTENYHYVRAAAVRQSPLLSHAASRVQFGLIREFVTGEAAHERYFLGTLTRWGIPQARIEASVPLPSTAQFIGLRYHLAHLSLLDYLAGSAVLEVEPDVYARDGDPYQARESACGVAPGILDPVRQHIREDVQAGHASLFRQVALAAGAVMPRDAAVRALTSARTVFAATRLWQRDMYEHYQLGGGNPPLAAL